MKSILERLESRPGSNSMSNYKVIGINVNLKFNITLYSYFLHIKREYEHMLCYRS